MDVQNIDPFYLVRFLKKNSDSVRNEFGMKKRGFVRIL